MSENPWTTLSSRVAYENAWITVREDQVLRPDGQPGIYGVVECQVATAVIALTPDHEVYLVGQYRYPTDEYSWEIIEGGAEAGESPLAAAQRELEEEAGLRAEYWEQLGGEVHLSNCHSSERGYVFLATDLVEGPPNPDPTEELAIRKVPFEDALAMVDTGEIRDAFSIIGLLRLARLEHEEPREH